MHVYSQCTCLCMQPQARLPASCNSVLQPLNNLLSQAFLPPSHLQPVTHKTSANALAKWSQLELHKVSNLRQSGMHGEPWNVS